MKRLAILALWAAAAAVAQTPSHPKPPRSGLAFQSEDVRKLQADDFANPGMGWVATGEKLWKEKPGSGPACAQCHQDARETMKGVAARYPKFDKSLGRVASLEMRIDACNRRQQNGPGLAFESERLLALSAYVAHQSRGMPIAVEVAGAPTKRVWEKGRDLYYQRLGQMNLACSHCHDAMWGRTLLAEKVSQGHPAAWPAYRLEWQSLGSLSRRLRACYFGVRAEQPPFGSEDLVALELYLADRAQGLPVEVPGIRR